MADLAPARQRLVALEYGLAAGDIPEYGEVVLRTIMPVASLHPAPLAVWEEMRASGRHVSVSTTRPATVHARTPRGRPMTALDL
jgi:hypothetical protein